MTKQFFLALTFSVFGFSTAYAQGAYTTAAEVKPIMSMTRASWVGVREWDENEILYFTHIESWRCGLERVKFAINSKKVDTIYELEDCYEGTASPNAITMDGHLPYLLFPLGTIDSVTIEITYDDGTKETETFKRMAITIP